MTTANIRNRPLLVIQLGPCVVERSKSILILAATADHGRAHRHRSGGISSPAFHSFPDISALILSPATMGQLFGHAWDTATYVGMIQNSVGGVWWKHHN